MGRHGPCHPPRRHREDRDERPWYMQPVHHPTRWRSRSRGHQTHRTGPTQQNKPWQSPERELSRDLRVRPAASASLALFGQGAGRSPRGRSPPGWALGAFPAVLTLASVGGGGGAPRMRSTPAVVEAGIVRLPRSAGRGVGPRPPRGRWRTPCPALPALSAALRPPPACCCFGLEGSRLRRS